MRNPFVLLAAGLVASGCGLDAPVSGELEGGVGHARYELRVRHTQLLPVDVFFPADVDGQVIGRDLPGLVYVQGGNVDARSYWYLGRALAHQGFVVAIPEVRSKLAILSLDDGVFARELLVDPPPGTVLEGAVDPRSISVAGHSLGGVVAAKLVLKEQGFSRLVLHASFADVADEAELSAASLPTFTLAGEADCSATLEDVRAARGRLPANNVLGVLSGVTHYQFTASDKPDRDRGCAPGVDIETAQERITEATAAFLRGDKAGLSRVEGMVLE